MEINCIILAGGKSVRLGRDKLVEKIGTTSLLAQVVSSVQPLSKKILIVTANERTFAEYANRPDIAVVSDIIPGQGSLGGLYTGLTCSDLRYNLVLAADMPFLNVPLLRYMIEVSDGFDCTLPHIGSQYEPLHAIYSKECLDAINILFSQQQKMIKELLNYVKVRVIGRDEVDRFDPGHLSFYNINTADDLQKAREIAEGNCPSC